MFNNYRHILIIVIIIFKADSVCSQNWMSLGNGVSNSVRCLYSDSLDSVVYVGGSFLQAGGIPSVGIAKWDVSNWAPLLNALNSYPVLAITKYKGEIYVGGWLKTIFGSPGNGIVKWDGLAWDSVGLGVDGPVVDMFVYNNELFVGGTFFTAGGDAAEGIAKWDGTNWSDVGMFPNYNCCNNSNTISAIIEYKGEIYIGGIFPNSVGNTMNIAKWDGLSWKPLGNGIVGNMAWINTFAIYNNELYVGGLFTTTDGNPGNYIAKWDGINWSDVGGGMGGINGEVRDMIIFNNELYVVGVFEIAGGVPAQYIAKWNGTEWCGLGSSFENVATAIGVYNSELYIGGGFETIDGDTVNDIAKWTGGNYTDTCGVIITGVKEEFKVKNEELKIYPNPAQKSFAITGNIPMSSTIYLFDITGRKVLKQPLNSSNNIISVSHLSKGMYIYKIQYRDDNFTTGKIIVN